MAQPNVGIQISGINELKENIAALISAVKMDDDVSARGKAALAKKAKAAIGMELREAAGIISDKAESNARSARWPHEALSVGAFRFFNPAKPKTTALAGFSKRGRNRPYRIGYVEWGKRSGKLVGESLARMFEYGTSKMRARPALRPAISSSRSQVLDRIADGYRKVITTFDWTAKG
jgi:HK97 gp10 family phage protein